MPNLLTPTGSHEQVFITMMHNLFANSRYPAPEVGMGATRLCYTNRHAFTIIAIVGAKKIVVQRDTVARTDANGMSESQAYSYEANPEGSKYILTLRSNGRWVVMGQDANNGQSFAIGDRNEYHDHTETTFLG